MNKIDESVNHLGYDWKMLSTKMKERYSDLTTYDLVYEEGMSDDDMISKMSKETSISDDELRRRIEDLHQSFASRLEK